ncbi:hypothetical protein [Draconibacterium sediminis]|uniref:hypothetical protein n=1 Tax=Draconibacterium sediminis TaxID=1544798 RepID=UPI0026EE6738|nr:hypothetical protein [Draconibacterium sediminis]
MISNISDKELKSIKKRLPDFRKVLEEDESFIETGIYKKIFISVFDHWLTKDEANKMIFIDSDLSELQLRRDKFESFTKALYEKTNIYFWKYKRNYRIFFKQPKSFKDILRRCDFNNLYSQSGDRYSLILPEYSAIYNEGWDWTNVIWYMDRNKIEPILEIAKKTGLNILE